jgi:hypothetical protein
VLEQLDVVEQLSARSVAGQEALQIHSQPPAVQGRLNRLEVFAHKLGIQHG